MPTTKIGFEIDGTRAFHGALKDFARRVEEIPEALRATIGGGISAGVRGAVYPFLQSPPPGSPPTDDEKKPAQGGTTPGRDPLLNPTQDEIDARGIQKGQQYGNELASDLSSLRSGDFASVLYRKAAYATQANQERQRKEDRMERLSAQMPRLNVPQKFKPEKHGGGKPGGPDSPGKPGRTIQRMRVERLELSAGGARMLAMSIQRGMRGAGGGVSGGGRGGGRGGGISDAAASGARGAASLPMGTGAVLGLASAAIGVVSSINQMREAAMQAQASTIGAVGLVNQGEGPAFMSNAEKGAAMLAAGQISGVPSESTLNAGARFGVAQGLGAAAGARIYAQAQQYGEGNASLLLGAADVSGFQGLRRGRYAQEVASLAEQSVSGGFGKLDIRGFGETTAGLSEGMAGSSALSLTRNLHQGFQSRGSTLQNLALAANMAGGDSYMSAMVKAERGTTRENMTGVRDLLQLKQMDPETRAIIEMQLTGSTATQAMGVSNQGGIFDAANRGAGKVRSAGANLKMPDSYMDMVGRGNQVDSILFGAEKISEAANTATAGLLKAAESFAQTIDSLVGKMTSAL